MNAFIFQTNPSRLDLRTEIEPGKRTKWLATRHQTEISPGDIAFFWMSGDKYFKGVYGWGIIVTPPRHDANLDAHVVDVEYKIRFKNPIKATTLERDSILDSLLVFRAPTASNFLLDASATKRLCRIIEKEREVAPTIAGDNND